MTIDGNVNQEGDSPREALDTLGRQPPETVLRNYLAWALTSAGYGRLCLEQDRPQQVVPPRRSIGRLIVGAYVAMTWAGIAVGFWLGLGFFSFPFALIVAVLTFPLITRVATTVEPVALVRSIPFLFPVTLLVLFVPLTTEDTWRVAAAMDEVRLVCLGIAIVLPLSLVLLRRLAASLASTVDEIAIGIGDDVEAVEQSYGQIAFHLGERPAVWASYFGTDHMRQGLGALACRDYPPFITAILYGEFRRRLMGTAAVMLAGLTSGVALYVYGLGATVIDSTIAREWTGQGIPFLSFSLLGLDISLPGGPYLMVVALLTVIAVGALLAFAATDKSFSQELTGALLHEPIRGCLLLALPYVRLRERVLAGDAPVVHHPPFPVGPQVYLGGEEI